MGITRSSSTVHFTLICKFAEVYMVRCAFVSHRFCCYTVQPPSGGGVRMCRYPGGVGVSRGFAIRVGFGGSGADLVTGVPVW